MTAREQHERVIEALGRIQGIADADGGRMLGDYGFATIKDALFNGRLALDALLADAVRAEEQLDALREALGNTKPPYRIAGIPPGIISADDFDVTDDVLDALAALSFSSAPGEGDGR